MILDGDFFDSGSWCGAKVACLETGKVSRLEFASDEVFRGLTGLMWFVSEKSLDTYFSHLEPSQYGLGYSDYLHSLVGCLVGICWYSIVVVDGPAMVCLVFRAGG